MPLRGLILSDELVQADLDVTSAKALMSMMSDEVPNFCKELDQWD